jgi:hypothetical protein
MVCVCVFSFFFFFFVFHFNRWNFAKEKNVLLPDEYDTINESLAPFWGFSLKERRARQREAEQLGWTFTLVKHEDGGISSDVSSVVFICF